jgi:hypothetical protein
MKIYPIMLFAKCNENGVSEFLKRLAKPGLLPVSKTPC